MGPIEIETASLKKIIAHYVGGKNNSESAVFSQEELFPGDEEMKILQNGFLNRFKTIGEHYSFHHTTSLEYNPIYNFCNQLFSEEDKFIELSHSFAKQLAEASDHPKIKTGELYIVLFEGLPVNGRMYKAIGIFKAESKLFYLDIQKKRRQVSLEVKEGIEPGRIDKGCLVINSDKENGYDVMMFDNQGRGEEALYWKEKFLGLKAREDDFHHTRHLLTLARQFITKELDSEHQLPKTEQVELLNRSIDYFKSHDAFNIEEFQNEVFASEEIIDSFRDYGSRYTTVNDYDIAASFDISALAVKKQSKIFKSIVKLDKNFHIYIHGRTDLIEKGVESDGRKFYKIYYQEEA
jgi:hypothetical protein